MTEILDLPLDETSGLATVRDYFKALLSTLIYEHEGFSGKRPFGESGWMYDLYIPLIRAGLVEGTFDEDGYVDTFNDHKKADQLITDAVQAL